MSLLIKLLFHQLKPLTSREKKSMPNTEMAYGIMNASSEMKEKMINSSELKDSSTMSERASKTFCSLHSYVGYVLYNQKMMFNSQACYSQSALSSFSTALVLKALIISSMNNLRKKEDLMESIFNETNMEDVFGILSEICSAVTPLMSKRELYGKWSEMTTDQLIHFVTKGSLDSIHKFEECVYLAKICLYMICYSPERVYTNGTEFTLNSLILGAGACMADNNMNKLCPLNIEVYQLLKEKLECSETLLEKLSRILPIEGSIFLLNKEETQLISPLMNASFSKIAASQYMTNHSNMTKCYYSHASCYQEGLSFSAVEFRFDVVITTEIRADTDKIGATLVLNSSDFCKIIPCLRESYSDDCEFIDNTRTNVSHYVLNEGQCQIWSEYGLKTYEDVVIHLMEGNKNVSFYYRSWDDLTGDVFFGRNMEYDRMKTLYISCLYENPRPKESPTLNGYKLNSPTTKTLQPRKLVKKMKFSPNSAKFVKELSQRIEEEEKKEDDQENSFDQMMINKARKYRNLFCSEKFLSLTDEENAVVIEIVDWLNDFYGVDYSQISNSVTLALLEGSKAELCEAIEARVPYINVRIGLMKKLEKMKF